MNSRYLRLAAMALLAGTAVLAFGGHARADPPSRVARLAYSAGAVSLSPAGESDWVQAAVNRPLTTGDRLWSDADARAEVEVGGAVIRMGAATGLSVLNLDDRVAQLQLTQGVVSVRVRHLEPDQVFEVDTPNLAFAVRRPGAYRIEVDPDGDATVIVLRQGDGVAYGVDASYALDAPQSYRFTGTDLRESRYAEVPRADAFDRWSAERDRRHDSSVSARYVSRDVIGYQDLDAYGAWRVDATYGNVWVPDRVAADWAPFRDGHWAWIDPWGWTWIDDAPWGFAVSHYGRWAHVRGAWAWVPGPVRSRAYYAPALVVFVGGANFQLTISTGSIGAVAWFPLGPREVYRPSYPVSRGYFERVNVTNTVIHNTVINNYYDSRVTNVVHVNRQVQGAVVAVPAAAFAQAQPVSRAALPVSRETVDSRPVDSAPPVAPTERSVRGAAARGDQPPARVFERPVVARSAPPAARAGFAAQEAQLSAKPGKPLDDAARRELKPAAGAPAPVVRVATPTQKAPPSLRAPAAPRAAVPDDVREKADVREQSEAREKADVREKADAPRPSRQPEAPTTAAPREAAPARAAASPAARPPQQRGRSEERTKTGPREPSVAPAPSRRPPARAEAMPQEPPIPAAQPPAQRKAKPPSQAASAAQQEREGSERKPKALSPP